MSRTAVPGANLTRICEWYGKEIVEDGQNCPAPDEEDADDSADATVVDPDDPMKLTKTSTSTASSLNATGPL
jgi:hypothetical protein